MNPKNKLFPVISFDKTGTKMYYALLTFDQLEKNFPRYVINMMVKKSFHLLSIDGKFRNFSFLFLTIEDSNHLAVEIKLNRLKKLSPKEPIKTFVKNAVRVIDQLSTEPKNQKPGTSYDSKAQMSIAYRCLTQSRETNPKIIGLRQYSSPSADYSVFDKISFVHHSGKIIRLDKFRPKNRA